MIVLLLVLVSPRHVFVVSRRPQCYRNAFVMLSLAVELVE